MNSSPIYNTGTYSYEKEKKSPIIYILIGVISVLLVILGVLFGMLLMKNKNENNNSKTNVINNTSTEATSATEEKITTSVESTEKTITTTATESVESTMQTTKSKVNSDEVKKAAKKITDDLPTDYKHSLYDVNGDDISELFVSYMGISGDTNYVLYYYDSSEFKELKTFWGGLSICTDSHYIKETNYGGAEVYKYYELTKDNKLNKLDEIYCTIDSTYYRNGQEISNSEYYATTCYYDDMNWADIESPSINAVPTETYAFYGIVATESDSLNLRDKPSTNSDVITQLPKGTKANVYYVEGYSDWYKIYTDNGYEGYVAAQYMKEYNESSNNNNTSYVPESQTPFGTFTYTNYRSSAYSSYTIYEPDTIGIYLNCDIDAFNAKHSDYRIDNIYFWTVKKYSSEGPHDYRMYFTFTGTVLSDSINKFELAMTLKNEETGESSITSCNGFKATLYKGETFCYDMISGYDYGEYVLDNTTYTLS